MGSSLVKEIHSWKFSTNCVIAWTVYRITRINTAFDRDTNKTQRQEESHQMSNIPVAEWIFIWSDLSVNLQKTLNTSLYETMLRCRDINVLKMADVCYLEFSNLPFRSRGLYMAENLLPPAKYRVNQTIWRWHIDFRYGSQPPFLFTQFRFFIMWPFSKSNNAHLYTKFNQHPMIRGWDTEKNLFQYGFHPP